MNIKYSQIFKYLHFSHLREKFVYKASILNKKESYVILISKSLIIFEAEVHTL